MEPNKDNIRLWAEALESDEYKQGNGLLRYRTEDGEDKLCCLGVACEAAIKAGVPLPMHGPNGRGEYSYGEEREHAVLPDAVRDWLGIGDCNPLLTDERGAKHGAYRWNDREGKSFPEIAAMIRRTYLGDD